MKTVILGSGRMGIRHAQGICDLPGLTLLCIVDKFDGALTAAKEALKDKKGSAKTEYLLLDDFFKSPGQFDVGILAATSQNRVQNCKLLIEKGVKHILVEKPLGQSMPEILELVELFAKNPTVKGYVNLNMRMYESFQVLRNDLNSLPQFEGEKNITLNTGTIGIGANGIHYLDLLYFILDADDAEIQAAEIDQQTVPSARGAEFVDFGGWAVIKFFRNKQTLGRALVSVSARSTVFGGWDIVGSHGRITVNEIQQKRVDILRKVDSTMPIYRYAADYTDPIETKIESPFLGELTRMWLDNIIKGAPSLLPEVTESVKVHQLLFDWLSYSKTHQSVFPIT